MQIIVKVFWVVTMFCALIAAFDVVMTSTLEMSAPQSAALSARVLAFVVIPYCFTRALDGLCSRPPKD